MEGRFLEMLRSSALKATKPRFQVLELISTKKSATSQPELERYFGKDIDRVTLYRILNSFEQKGLIHKVLDLHGTAAYAMCSSNCNQQEHHDEHAHFNCERCNNIYCLPDRIVLPISVPEGFKVNQVMTAVTGICSACSNVH